MQRSKKLTNDEIIQGILEEKVEIFSYLYREGFDSVRWLILRNSGSEEDAKDIFQESIIVLHQKLMKGDFTMSCSVTTYLYSVSRCLWLKELARRKKWDVLSMDEEILLLLDEPDQDDVEKEMLNFYYKQFNQLSNECKKILNLHFKKASIKEITRKLGYKSEVVTMDKKYRCKQRLIKKILKHPYFRNNEGR